MDKPIHCIRISKHILYSLSYSFFSWMIIKNTFSFSAYSIHIYFFNLIGFRTKLSAHFPFNDIVHRSISLIQNRCQKMWCTHHFGLLKNALKTSQSTRQVVVKYLQPFTKWQKNSTPSHPSGPIIPHTNLNCCSPGWQYTYPEYLLQQAKANYIYVYVFKHGSANKHIPFARSFFHPALLVVLGWFCYT